MRMVAIHFRLAEVANTFQTGGGGNTFQTGGGGKYKYQTGGGGNTFQTRGGGNTFQTGGSGNTFQKLECQGQRIIKVWVQPCRQQEMADCLAGFAASNSRAARTKASRTLFPLKVLPTDDGAKTYVCKNTNTHKHTQTHTQTQTHTHTLGIDDYLQVVTNHTLA